MKNKEEKGTFFENDSTKAGLLLIISIIFISLAGLAISSLCFDGFDLEALFILILSIISSIFFLFWTFVSSKNKKIRYFFLGKKVKKEIDESAKRFDGAPKEFVEEYKLNLKNNYQKNGKLFDSYDSNKTLNDIKNDPNFKKIYTLAYECVKSKGGFVEFFNKYEELKEKFDMANDFGYEYLRLSFLGEFVSNELRYLMNQVNDECDFNIVDIGFSERFTEKNNKRIQKLNEYYSPVLFCFETELKKLASKK